MMWVGSGKNVICFVYGNVMGEYELIKIQTFQLERVYSVNGFLLQHVVLLLSSVKVYISAHKTQITGKVGYG